MKIVNSFSGGETSAYQALILKQEYGDDVLNILANTGNEREEMLTFAQRFSEYHKLKLVIVEAVVNSEKGVGTTHGVKTFKTASRKEEPFIEVGKKYGVPNQAYPHCTRELKAQPIKSYLQEHYGNDYIIAIGIRRDEPKRYPEKPHKMFMHPLYEKGIRKVDVNRWFEKQPFRLDLHEHQGNCKTCWKKSDIKLAAIWQENPEYFDFPRFLEDTYGLAGHNVDGTPRKMFRRNRSTAELIESISGMKPYVDAYRQRREIVLCGDDDGGCGESCEPFQDELFNDYGW